MDVEKTLKALQLESTMAIEAVTTTINNLATTNEKIETTIWEIQEAKAKLQNTEDELHQTKAKNNKVIEKFKALIEA